MKRRIFGLETEFGVTFASRDERTLSADEVARYLFRTVVSWGRSSNVFLGNGSRLYLDVGSHPEFATAECDDIAQLIAYDRAGERIVEGLIQDAQQKLSDDGYQGNIHIFKNNTDSAGNSYGCHENYLILRKSNFEHLAAQLMPFLITRQIVTGSGHVASTSRGAKFCLSQRADHMWEAVSSATTRSRPIINTRDEPHADAELYRRLHIINGDSSMAEPTTMVKVGSTHLVLRVIESGKIFPDMTLDNPMIAIRDISHDPSGRALVTLSNGRTMSAIDIQRQYLQHVIDFLGSEASDPSIHPVLDLWERSLQALETDRLSLVERELDWVIKWSLITRYAEKHRISLEDPRIARLELAYHDISRNGGLYYKLRERGLIDTVVEEADIENALVDPPQTTRARLRGEFVQAAQRAHRDYTVDWVHLKLNDQAQQTVICKDPLTSHDDRVDRLIETMMEPLS